MKDRIGLILNSAAFRTMKLFIFCILLNFTQARFGDRVISMFYPEVNSRSTSRSKCSQPCQRFPYKIKLDKVLLLGGTSPEYLPFILSDQADENGEIDIGQCVGNCRPTIAGELIASHSKIACMPVEYGDIKTKIVTENIIQQGPTIEGLAITSCACSEITTCD